MYDVYAEHQRQLHASNPRLRQNFANSVFCCLTVNSGPRTVTDPHADSANRPDGWCGITCCGPFDHKRGGQLVLWDLKLVIDFPPGCTIFIPSALLVHSNCPIQPGERRYSMTQYTAGGLFRWEKFWENASEEERAQWLTDRATRWERGLALFPIIP
ncbi:hypothetical protein CPB85DRAFT_1374969 [Mucidula mucida]|nr:hypothetical protein CPB85DRAFT_1374969 [Mucidula mucida]